MSTVFSIQNTHYILHINLSFVICMSPFSFKKRHDEMTQAKNNNCTQANNEKKP